MREIQETAHGRRLYRTYTAAGALDYERESLQVTDGDSRVVEAQTEIVGGSSSLLRYSLSNPTMSVTVQTDGSGNVIWYEEFRPLGSSAYVASQIEIPVQDWNTFRVHDSGQSMRHLREFIQRSGFQ